MSSIAAGNSDRCSAPDTAAYLKSRRRCKNRRPGEAGPGRTRRSEPDWPKRQSGTFQEGMPAVHVNLRMQRRSGTEAQMMKFSYPTIQIRLNRGSVLSSNIWYRCEVRAAVRSEEHT